MKHIMFAIHDAKAHAYLPPFILHRIEMAQRVFKDCINDPTHQFSKNPADYTLFTIGTFDDNTANIKTEKMTKSLGNGIEFIENPFDPDQEDLDFNAFSEPQKSNSEEKPNA